MKWEFGYWGAALDSWYEQGLPKHRYPVVPKKLSTPTSHLYTTAWNSIRGDRLPKGIAVMAGGLYWPTQGFPLDNDVREYFGLDISQILVNVNLLFNPMFDTQVLEDNEKCMVTRDVDGVRRRFLKATATMPSGEEYPIKDRKSWEKLKEERINLHDVKGRLPANWDQLVHKYRNRDYPLALGGYPHGFFGTLANLMGYENLFYNYGDDPEPDPRHRGHVHRTVDRRVRRRCFRIPTSTWCTSGKTSPMAAGRWCRRGPSRSSCCRTTSA